MKSQDIKSNVEFILKNNQFSRDDDNTLIFLYWMKFDGLTQVKLNKIAERFSELGKYMNLANLGLTSTDSIKQARRDLQKEGLYRASDSAVQRRMSKRMEKMN